MSRRPPTFTAAALEQLAGELREPITARELVLEIRLERAPAELVRAIDAIALAAISRGLTAATIAFYGRADLIGRDR